MDKVKFRVSNLCGSCNRSIFCYASGVTREPFGDKIKQAFANGHEAEPKILQWAADNLADGPYIIGYSNGDIGTIETEHATIIGHVDGLGRSLLTEERYLFEVKNLAPGRLTELRKYGLKGAEPSYYMQIQLYMHGLQLKGWDYDKCIWIARNNKYRKDNDPQKYFVERVTYDSKEVDKALEKAEYIAIHVLKEKEIEPDRNPFISFFCQEGWCEFSKSCHEYWRAKYE